MPLMNINLPDFANKAIVALESRGHRAFAVGGCVRDAMRGVLPSDWDICTSAKPDTIADVFSEFTVLKTGIKHGTVTVMFGKTPLEITTFRIDGEYKDNRHPENVVFTDCIEEDLGRRDFTINAMAYSPKEGLIDPFGGQRDLNDGIIRCVGNAELRFKEDALRILRALRFSSVLSYDIEDVTAKAILANSSLLSNIAAERINAEIKKMLCGRNVEHVLLKFRKIIAQIIPELEPCFDFDQRTKYHIYDIWQHTVHATVNIRSNPDLRLTMLLHDSGKPSCFTQDADGTGHFYGHPEISCQTAEKALKRLRFDKRTISDVCTLIKYHDADILADEKVILKWLNLIGDELFLKLIEVKRADNAAQNPEYSYSDEFSKIEDMYYEMKKSPICYSIKHLNVNGNDLIKLGISDGIKIGNTLKILLDAVMDGEISNTRDELLEYVKKRN